MIKNEFDVIGGPFTYLGAMLINFLTPNLCGAYSRAVFIWVIE